MGTRKEVKRKVAEINEREQRRDALLNEADSDTFNPASELEAYVGKVVCVHGINYLGQDVMVTGVIPKTKNSEGNLVNIGLNGFGIWNGQINMGRNLIVPFYFNVEEKRCRESFYVVDVLDLEGNVIFSNPFIDEVCEIVENDAKTFYEYNPHTLSRYAQSLIEKECIGKPMFVNGKPCVIMGISARSTLTGWETSMLCRQGEMLFTADCVPASISKDNNARLRIEEVANVQED